MRKQTYAFRLSMWLFACLLVVFIHMPVAANAGTESYEGAGWETPQDPVLVYLEGLKEQNLDKMVSAYAIETYIAQFDLQAQVKRLNTYTMSMTPRLPNANALTQTFNVEARRNEIIQAAQWQMTSVCMPGWDFSQPATFDRENIDNEASEFVQGLTDSYDSVDFSTLKVLRFVEPEKISELYASEKNQENMMAQVAPYGADEVRSVVAFFMVDTKVAVLYCDVMRYGEHWYMFRSSGNIGTLVGLSAYTAGMVAVEQEDLMEFREELGVDEQVALDELLLEAISSMQ